MLGTSSSGGVDCGCVYVGTLPTGVIAAFLTVCVIVTQTISLALVEGDLLGEALLAAAFAALRLAFAAALCTFAPTGSPAFATATEPCSRVLADGFGLEGLPVVVCTGCAA
jgi:hypothetical protein